MLNLKHICCIWVAFVFGAVTCQSRSHFNPIIIQDSRLEPKVDGTFGFQYKTEDGISHAAQGDPTGFIQGSYSYKDPTGLKVNFNYFAGARKNQNSAPQPQYQPTQYSNPEPRYTPSNAPEQYSEPQPYQSPQEYRPRTRPPSAYTRSQYESAYEPRYTQTSSARLNEVYDVDDNQYRG